MSDERTTELADELYLLLPWYANRTLAEPDRRRVEAALERDPALRDSLARIQEELHETALLNQAIQAPRGGGIEALMSRIEAEAPRKDRTASSGMFRSLFEAGWGPRLMALAGVAAALVIFVESGALIDLMSRGSAQNGPYVIASAESANLAGQRVLIVAFTDGASLNAVSELLRANRASIIEGPLAGGLFRVAVPAASAPAVLQELRAHPDLVRFAGPGK